MYAYGGSIYIGHYISCSLVYTHKKKLEFLLSKFRNYFPKKIPGVIKLAVLKI